MLCPMKFSNVDVLMGHVSQYDAACEKEKCAWWHGDTQRCAIKGISDWLDSIWDLMYQKEKIDGGARE